MTEEKVNQKAYSAGSDSDVKELSGKGQPISVDFNEGQCAARRVLEALAMGLPHTEGSELLAETIGELTDVGLGWNNLSATQERFAGFADVLVRFMAPQGAQCAVWQTEASQVIVRASEGSRVAAALYEPLTSKRHA